MVKKGARLSKTYKKTAEKNSSSSFRSILSELFPNLIVFLNDKHVVIAKSK
jgi:hypothetical protein